MNTIKDTSEIYVLVTGFKPFAQFPINVSEVVANSLNKLEKIISVNGSSFRFIFHSIILTVDDEGSKRVAQLIKNGFKNSSDSSSSFIYDMIIHMGYSNTTTSCLFEVVARNIKSGIYESASEKLIRFDGPDFFLSTAPLEIIDIENMKSFVKNATINLNQIVKLSLDAGSYYCNETYFRTLYTIRKSHKKSTNVALNKLTYLPVVFLHLPEFEFVCLDSVRSIIYEYCRIILDYCVS